MKRFSMRGAALALALTMSLSAGGALAYTTPDFGDVPAGHWAYGPVMEMADAGIIKGTGEGQFSPSEKLSAAMFLTLVGRGLYDVAADGADSWYGPYVTLAQEKGLLAGTAITPEGIHAQVTRYDMAVVLLHAAQSLGVQERTVDTGTIADYGDIPTKYAQAVAQVYALGLITGDEAGRFNGGATMGRAEAATVLSRLLALRDAQEEEAAKPVEPEIPRTGKMVTFNVFGCVYNDDMVDLPGMTVQFFYKDGRLLGEGITDENGDFNFDVTVDKADYNYYDDVYYFDISGEVDGVSYYAWEPGIHFGNLYGRLSNSRGWDIPVMNYRYTYVPWTP